MALDKTNKEALVLIGNIYYSDRQDMETAEKYFREVLKVDQEYHVALTNLAGIVAGREEYKDIHPIQYLSLLKNANDSLAAVDSPNITRYVPSFIRDTNIILSTVQLIQLKQLFGVSLLDRINRRKYIKEAWAMYNEFDEIKDDKYNLISVPNKSFSGWRLLAWMYAAFMEFEPKLAKELKLDLSEEYEMAKELDQD